MRAENNFLMESKFFFLIEDEFVLYCIDGVVIAAQCTAIFLRSIVAPRMEVLLGREYAD